MGKISVRVFEEKVASIEEITIVIRAPSSALVDDYDFDRKAASNVSVTDWLDKRIKSRIGGNEVQVVNGEYATPHGRTVLDTLRNSYAK